jgi:hypothetical protein
LGKRPRSRSDGRDSPARSDRTSAEEFHREGQSRAGVAVC